MKTSTKRKVISKKVIGNTNASSGSVRLELVPTKLKDLHKAIDEHKDRKLDKKFKSNKFAKKYKWELDNKYAEGYNEGAYEALENANQVKSWNRSPISETVNVTYLFLAFIIGFSVCAIVLAPLVINSI